MAVSPVRHKLRHWPPGTDPKKSVPSFCLLGAVSQVKTTSNTAIPAATSAACRNVSKSLNAGACNHAAMLKAAAAGRLNQELISSTTTAADPAPYIQRIAFDMRRAVAGRTI